VLYRSSIMRSGGNESPGFNPPRTTSRIILCATSIEVFLGRWLLEITNVTFMLLDQTESIITVNIVVQVQREMSTYRGETFQVIYM
jgi:hypothetical protein